MCSNDNVVLVHGGGGGGTGEIGKNKKSEPILSAAMTPSGSAWLGAARRKGTAVISYSAAAGSPA